MGGEHIGRERTEGRGGGDNVVEVSFDRRRPMPADPSTPDSHAAIPEGAVHDTAEREARAIKACLRHLQEQAAAIDERMAAQLIGAAAQAIGEDTAGGGGGWGA